MWKLVRKFTICGLMEYAPICGGGNHHINGIGQKMLTGKRWKFGVS
jgi:hypothetical protein